jgi:hypothetical protein
MASVCRVWQCRLTSLRSACGVMVSAFTRSISY